jgi:hypothetical protein
LRAEAEERERLLISTQQLLKIAQEQLFKSTSSQGDARSQMSDPHVEPNIFKLLYMMTRSGFLIFMKRDLTRSGCATSARTLSLIVLL